MFFLLGILNGLGEIRAHKLRSMLTITCVMLGVASLVLIAGFITGLFKRWEVYESEYGWGQVVEVDPSPGGPAEPARNAVSPGRTLADVRAIKALSHHAAAVSPICTLRPSLTYNGRDSYVILNGVTKDELPVGKFSVDHGRFICDTDLERREPVIVLGSYAYKALFPGGDDPIGKIVQVNRLPFRVVGMIHDYVEMSGTYNMLQQKDMESFIPITTMQQRLLGSDQLDSLTVLIDKPENSDRLVEELNSIILATHRGVHDFSIDSNVKYVEQHNAMKRGYFEVGCGVGIVTLLVGGIGIMNLMLASINERVREIGIRKAIGAWNRDIFAQFMAEAMALSGLGGLAGVGVGVMGIRILRHAVTDGNTPQPALSIPAVVVGLAFSVFVGIVAGLYPALRASRLDPIEALRYE